MLEALAEEKALKLREVDKWSSKVVGIDLFSEMLLPKFSCLNI